MLLKTNAIFPKVIQDFACYFFTLLYIVEKQRGILFSADEIMKIYQRCLDKKAIGDECTIVDASAVFHIAGGKGNVLINPKTVDRKFPIDYVPRTNQEIIQCWYNPNTGFTHFVNGTPPLVTYDSLGYQKNGQPWSKTRREGKLISLRVVELA